MVFRSCGEETVLRADEKRFSVGVELFSALVIDEFILVEELDERSGIIDVFLFQYADRTSLRRRRPSHPFSKDTGPEAVSDDQL